MNTPFWRHCRAETKLAGAAPLVNFYRENGPSSMCKGYHISEKNSFGLEGYLSILLGQQLPHERPHIPNEAEAKLWEKHLAEMTHMAKHAYTVKQALEIIRSPKWRCSH